MGSPQRLPILFVKTLCFQSKLSEAAPVVGSAVVADSTLGSEHRNQGIVGDVAGGFQQAQVVMVGDVEALCAELQLHCLYGIKRPWQWFLWK